MFVRVFVDIVWHKVESNEFDLKYLNHTNKDIQNIARLWFKNYHLMKEDEEFQRHLQQVELQKFKADEVKKVNETKPIEIINMINDLSSQVQSNHAVITHELNSLQTTVNQLKIKIRQLESKDDIINSKRPRYNDIAVKSQFSSNLNERDDEIE